MTRPSDPVHDAPGGRRRERAADPRGVRRAGRERPDGLRYASFRLDDGVSFVHVAVLDGDENPLSDLAAFGEFQADRRALRRGPGRVRRDRGGLIPAAARVTVDLRRDTQYW